MTVWPLLSSKVKRLMPKSTSPRLSLGRLPTPTTTEAPRRVDRGLYGTCAQTGKSWPSTTHSAPQSNSTPVSHDLKVLKLLFRRYLFNTNFYGVPSWLNVYWSAKSNNISFGSVTTNLCIIEKCDVQCFPRKLMSSKIYEITVPQITTTSIIAKICYLIINKMLTDL